MKDNELRGVVLQKFYDLRRNSRFHNMAKVDDSEFCEKVGEDLFRICDQLGEYGLIDWKPIRGRGGETVGGLGKINASGADVIEENSKPPVSISFDNSIRIESSSHVQIGNSNIQAGDIDVEKLIAAVNNASATVTEKEAAKSLLKTVLENPILRGVFKSFLPVNPFSAKKHEC